jgi:hypothetical protein
MRGRPPVPEITRFTPKYTVDPTTGCWNWTAGIDKDGYGKFYFDGDVSGKAHRFAYKHFVGPLVDGLTIDHKCRNRRCVNPDHLQQITGLHNTMIGEGPGPINLRKTHCPKGHEYSPENTYVDKRGYRYCRQCTKDRPVNKVAGAERSRRWREKHGVYWSNTTNSYTKKI